MKAQQKPAPANNQQKQAGPFFAKSDQKQDQNNFFHENAIQPKLTINEPGDMHEQHADAVADKAVKHIQSAPAVQAKADQPAADQAEKKEEDKQEKSEGKISRKPIFDSDADPNEGNEVLKRKENGNVPAISDTFSDQLQLRKGSGSALGDTSREQMERSIGADFRNVRIHTDPQAAEMSQSIQAKAFTYGNDIYFNQGQYDPSSSRGQHLLAHELAHTVQQGSGISKKGLVQRTHASPTAGVVGSNPAGAATAQNPLDTTGTPKSIYVPVIRIPAIKDQIFPASKSNYSFKKQDRSGGHLAKWDQGAISGSGFDAKFTAKKNTELGQAYTLPDYFMTLDSEKNSSNPAHIITGTLQTIKAQTARLFWDENGRNVANGYDVDHKVELQLGGLDDTANLWMMEAGSNRSSGSNINTEINNKVAEVLDAATVPEGETKPSAGVVREEYTIIAGQLSPGLPVTGSSKYWELSDIQAGNHLEQLAFLSEQSQALRGLRDSSTLSLILSERYGTVKRLNWGNPSTGQKNMEEPIGTLKRNGANLKITQVNYTHADDATILSAGSGGTAKLHAFMNNTMVNDVVLDAPIDAVPGIYGGKLNAASIKTQLSSQLRAKALSPIQFQEVDINPNDGFNGFGKIVTNVPLIDNADIELVLDGDGLKIRKVFTAGEIHIPPPFRISNSSLEIFAATSGLGINGEVNFEINNLGRGRLGAAANSHGEFALSGSFDFDSNTFNPAHIEAAYTKTIGGAASDGFTASGDIGIPEGKIKGLKRATIHVEYAGGIITATGTAEPDIKGIRQANLTVTYGNDELAIMGGFTLDEGMPGIRSGSGQFNVVRNAAGEYAVTASGTAVPAIPGINTSLNINYDNGALTIEGNASYQQDRVAGEVRVGATNRAIAADGTPSGEPTDHFTAYGSGSLTIRVTDWLQATATVRITPAGEIEVVGRLELPSAVDVFARKSIERNLFHAPTIEIPLFAIPLGPRSIGLVATINGGLDFQAGIGPGQLRNVFGQIEYNPSHPENTHITGGAEFVIPANAGLTLHADLGVGASIAIASVTGGIELTGGVGLEGQALASVDLGWSPTTGFEFNARGEIEVHPKFTFNVNALLRASLDLGITSLSKEWRHNLASFNYGPDMQFKVAFPIHYKEGEPFDISFDDIQVTYPDIDIPAMAGGIADEVKNAIL